WSRRPPTWIRTTSRISWTASVPVSFRTVMCLLATARRKPRTWGTSPTCRSGASISTRSGRRFCPSDGCYTGASVRPISHTEGSHDFSNTTAPGNGDQVQQRAVLGLQRESPDAWQSARVRAGQDAQSAQRHHDGEPVLFRRQGREGHVGRGGNGVPVRRWRVLLFHEHRELRADAPDERP